MAELNNSFWVLEEYQEVNICQQASGHYTICYTNEFNVIQLVFGDILCGRLYGSGRVKI